MRLAKCNTLPLFSSNCNYGKKLAAEAPTGRAKVAQGNALGYRRKKISPEGASQAFEEHVDKEFRPPLQGLFIDYGLPRALPWATLGKAYSLGLPY